MSALKERVDDTIAEFGEDILINGTTPAKGIFMLASLTTLNTYFDAVELSYITRPGMSLQVSADTVLTTGDTIERDGRVFSVQKMLMHRIQDEVLMQTAIIA